MEPVHRIAPRRPDIVNVPSVHFPPVGPEEREQKRREREEARERARRREAAQPAAPADDDEDDGRPHIDLTA